MSKKKITAVIITAVVLCALIAGLIIEINRESTAAQISPEYAQQYVNEQFDNIAGTKALKAIADKNNITVNSLSYGDKKDIILDCTVETLDARGAISGEYDAFMSADDKKKNGTMFKSALDFKLEFEDKILSLLETAEEKTENCQIVLYDTANGLVPYTNAAVVNTVFGGICDIADDINGKETAIVTDAVGNQSEKNVNSSNLKKGFIQCISVPLMSAEPDTSTGLTRFWSSVKYDFDRNFIQYDRWKTIFSGLWVTIKLTIFALVLGIIIGFMVAFVRCTYLKTTKHNLFLRITNAISQVYLTVVRGTPVVVQIMIIYFVIFMPWGVDKFIAAVICFGLNSGAYVAEIVRGGIMSIDNGQMEAGRSLGFNYFKTMYYIIFPQAFKTVLPSLANEFVVLLKETSVAFYIGLGDLMYAGNAIRAATYSPFMPLVSVAIIYLAMVLVLSRLVGLLERRLRNNER